MELTGAAYCNGHKRYLVGHLPLTEMQMFRSGMVTAATELKNHTWTTLQGKAEGETGETTKTEKTESESEGGWTVTGIH